MRLNKELIEINEFNFERKIIKITGLRRSEKENYIADPAGKIIQLPAKRFDEVFKPFLVSNRDPFIALIRDQHYNDHLIHVVYLEYKHHVDHKITYGGRRLKDQPCYWIRLGRECRGVIVEIPKPEPESEPKPE